MIGIGDQVGSHSRSRSQSQSPKMESKSPLQRNASIQNADKLVVEATGLRKRKRNVVLSFFGIQNVNEDYATAATKFNQAGNIYKSARNFEKAEEAYQNAATTFLELNEETDATRAKADWASCLAHTNKREAIRIYQDVVDSYTAAGTFSLAARNQHEIAKLYEALGDYENAIDAYEKTAQFYEVQNASSSALPYKVAAAKELVMMGNYQEAADRFERIGRQCLDSGILKYGGKTHFLNAVLCKALNEDEVGASRSLLEFQRIDPSASSMRDYKGIASVLEAVCERDGPTMQKLVDEFKRTKRLDEFTMGLVERLDAQVNQHLSLADLC